LEKVLGSQKRGDWKREWGEKENVLCYSPSSKAMLSVSPIAKE